MNKYAIVGGDVCKIGQVFKDGATRYALHPTNGKNPYVCFTEREFKRLSDHENQTVEAMLKDGSL